MPNPYPQCDFCTSLYDRQQELRAEAKAADNSGAECRKYGALAEAEEHFRRAKALIQEADELFQAMQGHAGGGHK